MSVSRRETVCVSERVSVCVYGQLTQIPSGTRVHACPAMIITAKLRVLSSRSVSARRACSFRGLWMLFFPQVLLNMDV